MSNQKPGIPKGTRDFGPLEMARRNYIFQTIQDVFNIYGYMQIETPAMENLDTLLGKYGEEGDKLLFKILNSGDFLGELNRNELQNSGYNALSVKICEKGLRYDLTVPFARFVVQHQNEIIFPFKRFQIQPVWRADRPQKGRYREFYQCDADVIGSNSLLNEAELMQIIDMVFTRLGLKVTIKLNNRKILAGIAEYIGQQDKITDITVAIDKLEKIGIEAVNQELSARGITAEGISRIKPVLDISGNSDEKIKNLKDILAISPAGLRGIEEMELLLRYISKSELKSKIEIDIALARGLNYYTGTIIEVKADDVEIGSICGGGRYDDLTGIFGLKDISGVGISFGADRIYDVLEQLNLFPADTIMAPDVLFVNFGEREALYCLELISSLRKSGISAELYPDAAKMKKQLGYADSRKIKYAALVGEDEMAKGNITLKNLTTGEQKTVLLKDLIDLLEK